MAVCGTCSFWERGMWQSTQRSSRPSNTSLGFRQAASVFVMTAQTTIPVVRRFLPRCRKLVWVVAGDTAHLARTLLKATALVHLFNLAEESALSEILRLHEHRFDGRQRQTRAVVGETPARPDYPDIALQVALLADCFTQFGLEAGRVHDVRQLVTDVFGLPNMKLARAVASLTADRVALEDRLFIPVLGLFDVIELVRMTKQASRFDESLEMKIIPFVAGGQVPFLLRGIPCDR